MYVQCFWYILFEVGCDMMWYDVMWRQWMNRGSNKQDVILNDSFSGNNCPRPRLDFDIASLCAALIRNLCIGTFLFVLYLQSRPTFLTPAIFCGEGSSETTLNGFLPNLSPTSRDPRRVQECQEVNRAVTWHVFLILYLLLKLVAFQFPICFWFYVNMLVCAEHK